ncbi:hypothetical protein BOO88_16685 [Stutzerimonas stutzeri]|nr:hypothetical protein BOO89_02215 [Stutzerimonas stutzeri]AZO90472.1 hypothetical protein BOO88_16685 [Stutzerimonas stutzeri]
MSSIEFLEPEEIRVLTDARTRAGQIDVLRQNGIRHTIKRNGWPCVTTMAVIGSLPQQPKEKATWQSNKVC